MIYNKENSRESFFWFFTRPKIEQKFNLPFEKTLPKSEVFTDIIRKSFSDKTSISFNSWTLDFKTLFAPAKFTDDLREVGFKCAFQNSKYDKQKSYLSALSEFRKEIQKKSKTETERENLEEISYKIMTLPLLVPGIKIMSDLLPEASPNFRLSEQLKKDRQAIRKLSTELHEGSLHRLFRKLSAKLNLFDPHVNGNMPFSIGYRSINKKPVVLLRHPVPTIEAIQDLKHKVEITPEYKTFLDYCKRRHQKILYCDLLNPAVLDESFRQKALEDLGKKNPEVFFYLRIPLDGALSKDDPIVSLLEYKQAIERNLRDSLNSRFLRNGDFIFSPNVKKAVEKRFQTVLNFAYEVVSKSYRKQSLEKCKESKQALFILFSTCLKQVLIKDLGVRFYNNTCKDAIDRGAVHLVSDVLWDCFLTDQMHDSSVLQTLRVLASWPAFMAKTQAVLSKRSEWMESFALFLEEASRQGLAKNIARKYKDLFDLKVDSPKFDGRIVSVETKSGLNGFFNEKRHQYFFNHISFSF